MRIPRPPAWFLDPPPIVHGLTMFAIGGLLLAANLTLPIFTVTSDGHRVDFFELWGQGQVAYEYTLLLLPLLAAFLLLTTGGLRIAYHDEWRPGSPPDTILTFLEANAGLVAAVAASRWLGFYTARLLDNGDPVIHLDALPYVNLTAGLLLLAYAAYRILAGTILWRNPEMLTYAIAAATLVLMPILPFAVLETSGESFHYDELTLETIRATGQGSTVLTFLAIARGLLWLTAAAAITAAYARQSSHRLRHAQGLAAAAAATGAVFTILYYLGLPDALQGASWGYNHVIALGYASLLAAVSPYVWHTSREMHGRYSRDSGSPDA